MKQVIRMLARKLGYDFRKIGEFGSPTLVDFLSSRSIDVVLDVGANVGQFGSALRQKGYRGEIVSFEPIASEFQKLNERASRDSRWSARNIALGDLAGRTIINVSRHSVFSSILPQSEAGRRLDQSTAVDRTEKIDIVRLDEIFEPFRGSNVFMKVDTQGYERQVLAGASGILEILKGIQLELPIVHLYENTWRFEEAIGYMRASGFCLSHVVPVGFQSEDTVSLLEVDCVFRRMRDDEH